MARRIILGPLAVAVAALLVAPSANAGGIDASIKVAKGDKHGKYKDYVRQSVPDGATRELWFRVKGKASNKDPLTLRFNDDGTSSGEPGYKVKWFKHGDNISADVKNEGYEFHVDPGESKYFNARVSADDPPPDNGMCLAGVMVEDFIQAEDALAAINTECAMRKRGDDILMSVKEPGGNYSDAVNPDIDPGETKAFKVKATNTDVTPHEVTMQGFSFSDPQKRFKARWYRGKKDITKPVKQGTYEFNLGGGASKTFKVTIKAKGNGIACVRTQGTIGAEDGIAFIAVNENTACV